jgi:DNA-binding CsgD family transcriptional regulator
LDDEPATTLTEAWRGFRALDAEVWRGRAAGALRARRLPVPRARRASSGELTQLERDIVMLVYEGLSNEKIAERLSYSRHSITAYLGKIYAKTGCATRLDLVRAVTEGVLG